MLAAAGLALAAPSAQAAIVAYTNLTSFTAALAPGSFTQTFGSLPATASDLGSTSMTFTGGGYSFTARASQGLYSAAVAGNRSLTVNAATDPLVIDTMSGPAPVTAIGGFVYTTDFNGTATVPTAGISVTAANGSGPVTQSASAPTTTSTFIGFISDGAALTSFQISSVYAVNAAIAWPTLDNLILGQSASVSQGPTNAPEPTSLAVLGVGLLGLVRRRARRG